MRDVAGRVEIDDRLLATPVEHGRGSARVRLRAREDVVFLLVGEGENVTVGTPVVSGAKVTGKILSHGRDKKVIVFKMRRRKNYRRKQGHRQHFTELEVTEVSA